MEKRNGFTSASNRKVIAYLAISADGYIAREDGSVDWLHRPRPKGNYGMRDFLRSIDTILWGRKTYDQAVARGGVDGGFGLQVKHYVFTHHAPEEAAPGVKFVNRPVGEFAEALRAAPGRDIWMMGGGGLIASFLDAGAIDEFMVHVVPVFIGEGIPLIQKGNRTVRLALQSSEPFEDGVVRLHYRVLFGTVPEGPDEKSTRAGDTARGKPLK